MRYRPIRDGSEVGGDFYDVLPLNDGTWLATVGDICGKGTAAAVLTGVMRSTIRALALHETDLEPMVRAVNEALLRENSPQALASLGTASLRCDAGGVAVCVATGGHPPPPILRAGGAVEVVESAEEQEVAGMQALLGQAPTASSTRGATAPRRGPASGGRSRADPTRQRRPRDGGRARA